MVQKYARALEADPLFFRQKCRAKGKEPAYTTLEKGGGVIENSKCPETHFGEVGSGVARSSQFFAHLGEGQMTWRASQADPCFFVKIVELGKGYPHAQP